MGSRAPTGCSGWQRSLTTPLLRCCMSQWLSPHVWDSCSSSPKAPSAEALLLSAAEWIQKLDGSVLAHPQCFQTRPLGKNQPLGFKNIRLCCRMEEICSAVPGNRHSPLFCTSATSERQQINPCLLHSCFWTRSSKDLFTWLSLELLHEN